MPEANGQYYYEFKKGHLEPKYLKLSVQRLIWVCYGSKMQQLYCWRPYPPASEYWRALEGNGNYSVEDTFTPKL